MKPALLDTDILSEYFRGNTKVISKVEEYLTEYNSINLTVITYYEILNGLLYKDAKKQLANFQNFIELNTIVPLTVPERKNFCCDSCKSA